MEKYLHMRNMEQINNVYNLWCFNAYYAVLLQNLLILRFTLFCRKICFVAIYALLRGEKMSQKLCLWRKKDKYHVCLTSKLNGNVFRTLSTGTCPVLPNCSK